MIPVAPDMVVDTESEVTKKAQDGVLEFLLINHPLDCPVCDKGGECPLQDQTLSYGPGESRFVEEKRHFEKPIMISDLVALDRERCILCDRCTRFADEVAGDTTDPLPGPGEPDPGQHLPRSPLRQLLQRQHGPDLPRGRAHRHALSVQGPPLGPGAGREHVHGLGRVPHPRPVQPQRDPSLPGGGRRPGQLGLAVRQGAVRLRVRQQRGPARPSPGPPWRRARRGALGRGAVGGC